MSFNGKFVPDKNSSEAPVRLTITKLMSAVKQGNVEAVRNSLQHYGLPVNGIKTTDYGILQAALQRSHREIAKLLIEHNCNVNNPTYNRNHQPTPLYLAVNLKDNEVVYMLLQKGAIIDIIDERSGLSPVHLAAINCLDNILWKLLHFNTDVNFNDSKGRTVLQILLQKEIYNQSTSKKMINPKLVQKLMQCKASLNCCSGHYNETPLHLAALHPQKDILEILLPHSADLNQCDSQGNSILHCLLSTKFACSGTDQEQKNVEIVNAMLTKGVRLNGINKYGQVPAHLAAKNRHISVLELLLQFERCINRVDNEGKTILHKLIEDFEAIDESLLERYRHVIKIIIQKGGRADYKSTMGDTAMHLAAKKTAKDPNVLWFLLQGHSVDANTKDKNGLTILHLLAAESNPNIQLIKLLMTKGLKVDDKYDSLSPIQIAAKNNKIQLLSEFLPYITDVNATDFQDGNTLMHHLLKNCSSQKLIEILLQKGASIDIKNKQGLAPTFYAAETMPTSFLLALLRRSQDLPGQALMKDSQTNCTLLHSLLNTPSLDTDGYEVLRILLLSGAHIDQLNNHNLMPLHNMVLYIQPDLLDMLITNVRRTNFCGNNDRTLLLFLDKLPLNLIQNEPYIIKITKMLLNFNCPLEGTNNVGKSVFNLVCKNTDLLTVILTYGQNIAAIRDPLGNTVLHTYLMDGVQKKSVDIIKLLIEKGVSLEMQNNDGETALHLSAKNGDLQILQLLMEKSKDVNIKDKHGNDVLHVLLSTKIKRHPPKKAIEANNRAEEEFSFKPIRSEEEKVIVELINKLLQMGLTINATNNAGETHLHVACRSFYMDVCRHLMQSGAAPQISDKFGNTSLHFMAQANTDVFTDIQSVTYEQEMVWYLMSRGCGPNNKNYVGRTPLHIASKNGRIQIVEALVTSGADINCVDSVAGASPLHLAAANRHANVIGILAMCGADINARQSDGSSVLQVILHNPLGEDDADDDLVSHLLKLGADPEQRDNYGKSSLHWACWNDDKHGLRALLDYGASLDAEDDGGFPPLHYATSDKIRINAALHLTKLQVAGIAISKKNETMLKSIAETIDLKEVTESTHYEAEVQILRQNFIDSKTSLYDILHKDINSVSNYENNIILQNLLNSEELRTCYPHYGQIIKSCIRKGEIRKELIISATNSLSHLAGTPVPLTCSIQIFDLNFNNESLRCLVKAGINAKPSRKRRSSFNEENVRSAKHVRRLSV